MDTLLITLLLCCLHLACAGRTEVQVLVPPVVRRGSTVTLLCLHNLTADDLYSVKWYRGNYEFYRFLPRERPPATAFPLPGLEVDMNGSSGQQVTIRVLSRHISGTFTCEVSAEEPSFSTSSASANISVIDIGLRKPLVIPGSSVHVVGTPLQINCSAQPTVPAPNISFYIDDVKVNKSYVRMLKPGLATLQLARLTPGQGEGEGEGGGEGPVWVRCEASVSGVYHLSSASIPVLEQQPSRQPSASNGASSHYSITFATKCLLMFCLTFLVEYKLTK